MSASASGELIVFQRTTSQHSVYVGDLAAGNRGLGELRRLTFGEARDDYPHAWTPDSKAIYVESSRTGHWAIFKQTLDRTTDEAVIQGSDDLYYSRVSPDGAWLLYIDRPRDWQETQPLSLMRLAFAGGLPQLVLKATAYASWGFRFNCLSGLGRPCVLAERRGNQIAFRAFDPLKGFNAADKDVARIDFDPKAPLDWDLAPDGSRLAWAIFDPHKARVHIEGQSDVALKGWSGVHAISWSPNGDGWFVITQLRDSWTLLHAGLDGRTHILRQGSSRYTPWPVPSPDGRHLALSQEGIVSNVWMLEER